jgi:hypothetical protein
MKKIAFIIPYFGKFNNYFQLFLNSCAYNEDIADWLIFTDDRIVYNYPHNVHIFYTDFDSLKSNFQKKFNFEIRLERPYKLCDLKPMYGYLFEDYLTSYEYWGHCDTDLIWGKISNFINLDTISERKLFQLGHCTIYKNDYETNRLFLSPLNGVERAKQVLQTEQNCSFDEEYKNSINNIFESLSIPIYKESFEANIYTKSSFFRIVKLKNNHTYKIEKVKHALFLWKQGNLQRYVFSKHNRIEVERYMYIHMQSRRMKIADNLNQDEYKIIPNIFANTNSKNIVSEKWYSINLHYFKLRTKNLYLKIQKRFHRK